MVHETFWHVYFDEETVERSERLRREYCIETADSELHLDAYLCHEVDAPLILLTHGEGSYSRMFVRQALALHERGCSVLVLDQRGHGFSSGSGDFTLAQLAQDVLDAAHWARRNFSGPLFLGGVNQGGWLAYQASALGAPVVGLVLHHLYDFTSPRDVLSGSRLAGLANLPGGVQVAGAAVRTLMAVSPRMRVPVESLNSFEGMLDERDNGHFEAWQRDPIPRRTVSMRFAASALNTPPALPFEENALPVLVINAARDRMIDPEITRRSFARLGGPKEYCEVDYGHWSMLESFAQEWAGTITDWIEGLKS